MRKFEETGSVLDKARSGRPSADGDRTDIVMILIAAANDWGVVSVGTVSHFSATLKIDKNETIKLFYQNNHNSNSKIEEKY